MTDRRTDKAATIAPFLLQRENALKTGSLYMFSLSLNPAETFLLACFLVARLMFFAISWSTEPPMALVFLAKDRKFHADSSNA